MSIVLVMCTDIGMEAIKNIKMVEAAREEAKRILTEDLLLAQHPILKEKLAQTKISHFE